LGKRGHVPTVACTTHSHLLLCPALSPQIQQVLERWELWQWVFLTWLICDSCSANKGVVKDTHTILQQAYTALGNGSGPFLIDCMSHIMHNVTHQVCMLHQ